MGVQVGDLEAFAEFAAAPVAVRFGDHQGGDAPPIRVRRAVGTGTAGSAMTAYTASGWENLGLA